MFALGVHDQGNEKFSARLFSRAGSCREKPFYFRHEGFTFGFASELKALEPTAGIDFQALNHYLALGFVPFDLCIAEGVKKLLPGHAGVYDCRSGSFRTWRYWDLPQNRREVGVSGDRLASESWDLLRESVRLRLRSDAP